MLTTKSERIPVRAQHDVVAVRQLVRAWALEIGMSLVELTKLVTAASEIARNTATYGGGGTLVLEQVRDGIRAGVRLVFEDQGPGIPDVARALTDGYTSGNGMGLGLGGSKRLVDDFEIVSVPGAGTTVTLVKWKAR